MIRPASWTLCLCLLSLPLAYAVFTGGADDARAFSVTVFDLGLAGLAGGLLLFRAAPASRPERVINAAALFFLAYVAFQLVPLPLWLLRVLSPTRAEVAEAVIGLTGGSRFAPLTVAPPTTWLQLSRITSYAVAFFVSRQLVRRSPFGRWTAALPLVAIGAAEAAWALWSGGGATELLTGTYPNRNHLAGLLEMTMPFALMYGLSVLNRSGRRGVLAMTDVAQAAVPLALTCLMVVAILFSSSKSGAVACLLSLFFVTALALGRGMSRGGRFGFLAALTVLFFVVIVFLTPSDLVQRFGAISSDQPTEGRVPIWTDTLRLIAAYPLFGCGLGAFFPAFLRYQFTGVGWAWTNTHNDYLQLLSELGIVGFIAPAVLIGSVFQRAVAASSEPVAQETRFIGLACAGSLLAILIHSVTDFNTYVTANGLVLAWVAGIAATLGPPATVGAPRASSNVEFGVGPIVLLLGLAVTAYGGAWLMLLQRPGDAQAERAFCRFGVCDTEIALKTLRAQARAASPTKSTALPADVLLSYLVRDPAAPYRWDELGDAFFRAGQRDKARLAFARAVALGPTSASTLLMAADFQFDAGQKDAALDLTSRALKFGDSSLYDGAFYMLATKKVALEGLPELLGMDKPTTVAFLKWFLQTDWLNVNAARTGWAWAVKRGYADDAVARDYTNALLGHKRGRDAWEDWVSYASRGNTEGYPTSNRIFNGGFERESGDAPFDWRLHAAKGVKVTFDGGQPLEAKRALRLTFDGTENVGEIGVMQQVYLEPGQYVFRAHTRSHNLTTDQGVAFRISFEPSLRQPDLSTDVMRGTVERRAEDVEFEVPNEGGFVTVRLARKPSLKFDKLVKGTVWVDDVRIIPFAAVKP